MPEPLPVHPLHVVVMGVAGCGKSTVGQALSRALGLPLIEGDDFHTEASKAKMRSGQPLTDADRDGWLQLLGGQLAAHPQGAVLACSALKRRYRDLLRGAVSGLRFVYLEIPQALAHDRVAARAASHLFPPSLVASQFATLEPPAGEAGVLPLDGALPLQRLSLQALQWLDPQGGSHAA